MELAQCVELSWYLSQTVQVPEPQHPAGGGGPARRLSSSCGCHQPRQAHGGGAGRCDGPRAVQPSARGATGLDCPSSTPHKLVPCCNTALTWLLPHCYCPPHSTPANCLHLLDPPTPAFPCLQGATGPVHAVLSENMAAYHFWSVDTHRWQVAAIELYDASPTTMRCAAAG